MLGIVGSANEVLWEEVPEYLANFTVFLIIVHVLSDDSAYVLGKWKLKAETWTREGLFTTILKKMEGGWKIIHDHSS